MTHELSPMFMWTFTQETDIPADVHELLVEGERPICAYRTIRDVATITDRRFLVVDRQGITGKKVEIYTIPFKSIVMYSSENAGGLLDVNSELEIWTRAGRFKINLKKGIDIRKLDRLLAEAIL